MAEEFFGPLGRLSDEVTDTFTVDELRVVARFLDEMTTAMDTHAARG